MMDNLIEDILFSSSSSDEDIENLVINGFNLMHQFATNLERQSRSSIENYVERVIPNYSHIEFIKMFRLERGLVEHLSHLYENTPEYGALKDNGGLPTITAWKQFLIYLWFVGHEAESYEQVVDRFNVSRSTVFSVITRISKYVCENLGPQTIKFPSEDRKNQTKEHYNQHRSFPGVIGSLDGTHIRIDRPQEDPDSYVNRNKYFSIHVQVFVNEAREFYHVFVGYPGSVHDARVFRSSTLYERLPTLCQNFSDLSKWSDRMKAPLVSTYGTELLQEMWSSWVNVIKAISDKNAGDICKDKICKIQCPTLILHGNKDPMVAPEHPGYLLQNIKGARLHRFPEGKHNIHLRYASEFNEMVSKFLEENHKHKM